MLSRVPTLSFLPAVFGEIATRVIADVDRHPKLW